MERKGKLASRREVFQAAALGLAAAGAAGAAQEWMPKKARAAGPIRSGHLLFLGGIGGWYPERRPEGPPDIRQQTRDALGTMKESLEKAGSSMANVLKVSVALVDPEANWQPMDEVYNTFFQEPKPARSYWGATGFRRKGQLLQIDCIAYVD
jgi:2-iminobutanoate/2-iminopropanoate deaminase